MQIVDNISRVTVGVIECGHTFRHDGDVYIMTDEFGGMYKHECVNLKSGKHVSFETDTFVEPVNAEVVIK